MRVLNHNTDLSLHPGFWSYLLFWDVSSVHQDGNTDDVKGKDESEQRKAVLQ